MTNGFQIAIGTGPGEVDRAAAAFAAFADAHALPASVRRSLHVALDELLTNAAVHGFGGREGGSVTVEVELRADRISATVTDDGKPFNPLGVGAPDTALPLSDRPVGGVGIHLVRGLLDEIRYERRSGRNVVVVAKQLPAK